MTTGTDEHQPMVPDPAPQAGQAPDATQQVPRLSEPGGFTETPSTRPFTADPPEHFAAPSPPSADHSRPVSDQPDRTPRDDAPAAGPEPATGAPAPQPSAHPAPPEAAPATGPREPRQRPPTHRAVFAAPAAGRSSPSAAGRLFALILTLGLIWALGVAALVWLAAALLSR